MPVVIAGELTGTLKRLLRSWIVVEWFERAAEAPAPTREEAHALFYDLAETLEAAGEQARALAVWLELQTDAGGYRDVAERVVRLTKAQARG